MWTQINEALIKFPPMKKHIRACDKYYLHWNPIEIDEANENLQHIFYKGIKRIEINTPSRGRVWTSNPVYRYIGEKENIIVFVKCGSMRSIVDEYNLLHEMRKKGVNVPLPIGIFTEQREAFARKPIRGAILITEFLHSVSLGHSIVEERFCINCLCTFVHHSIRRLHESFLHGCFTHTHIRVCVAAEDAKKLIFGEAYSAPQIPIKDVVIVGPTKHKIKDSEKELNFLRNSMYVEKKSKMALGENYLGRLEKDIDDKLVTTLDHKERVKRYKKLLCGI